MSGVFQCQARVPVGVPVGVPVYVLPFLEVFQCSSLLLI